MKQTVGVEVSKEKVFNIFLDIRKEVDWLSEQKGWELIDTNRLRYKFVECDREYNYEYVYFNKNKRDLLQIMEQITDSDVELVCNSTNWVLFKKDAAKGEIHVLGDDHMHYKIYRKRFNNYLAMSVLELCLAINFTLSKSIHDWFFLFLVVLLYLFSMALLLNAFYFRKCSKAYKQIID